MASDKDKNKKKNHEDSAEEPVVRDKRRIDPETGEARKGAENTGKDAEESVEHLTEEDLARLLEEPAPAAGSADSSEHLVDLKRVQAEYANYRKRVERDRHVARELAIAEMMQGMLPLLDDLDLAHAHGDLEGSSLDLVAKKIRALFDRYGVVKVGEVGEPFDPNLHEAIAQLPGENSEVDTIVDVVQPGYLFGERLLRAAKVAVSVAGD